MITLLLAFVGELGGIELFLLLLLPPVLWIISLSHLMQSGHDGTYKLRWTIIIVFLPVLGAFLYLIVGKPRVSN